MNWVFFPDGFKIVSIDNTTTTYVVFSRVTSVKVFQNLLIIREGQLAIEFVIDEPDARAQVYNKVVAEMDAYLKRREKKAIQK